MTPNQKQVRSNPRSVGRKVGAGGMRAHSAILSLMQDGNDFNFSGADAVQEDIGEMLHHILAQSGPRGGSVHHRERAQTLGSVKNMFHRIARDLRPRVVEIPRLDVVQLTHRTRRKFNCLRQHATFAALPCVAALR